MHLKLVERYETLIKKRRRRSHHPQPLAYLIPNLLTIFALCSGMTAIRFAYNGQIEQAVTAVLLAMILDGLDGRIARLLKCTSQFGAQLDSLADVVGFGVAPGIVLYLYKLHTFGNPGWGCILFFCACRALRLARFNVGVIESSPAQRIIRPYSIGLPIPAGALWALAPVIFNLGFHASWVCHPAVIMVNTIIAGLLMVSRIPTILINKIRIKPNYVLPALALCVLVCCCIYSAPWVTLSVLALVYVAIMPVTIRKAMKDKAGGPDGGQE